MTQSDNGLFLPERYTSGSTITKKELGERLAMRLNIPKRFGSRLCDAYDSVISDALLHNETVKIGELFSIHLKQLEDNDVVAFNKVFKRSTLFKLVLKVGADGTRLLKELTRRLREGEMCA